MRALFLFLALIVPMPALAHDGHGAGLVAGFLHPLTGPDHLAAMIAVGLWAGILGGRAMLRLPVGFLGGMLLVAAASEGASRLALRCAGGATAAVATVMLLLPA